MSARPLHATERAALLLQLVPYLLGKGEVSVAEAADEFEVTPDQMREMVQKLTVIGRPGEGGFWQLPNDLFDIDWDLLDERDLIVITNSVGLERAPRLTAREAAALLAGLQLAATLPGVGDSGTVQNLIVKLARGAASAPAEVIVAPGPVDDVRVTVAEALRRGVAVSFTYQAPDAAPTTRTVDPAKVHIADGQWYLQGWCHMREGMRTFHLERVSEVALTEIPVSHSGEPVPQLFEPGAGDVLARVRYPRQIAPLLGEYLSGAQIAAAGELATATMRVADEQSLKRVATRLGGDVEVLAPVGARRAAAAWAAAGLAQYR
ncbi:helix-turn-helix transcriptional regulator [Microbacterium jiangjiandongii]|uniref:helix-turn-helix transcriptional regulator n=1 Tax=Microbacterium jiangjiandongii TaxID=3049071 RepID=UPI00214B4F7D|nr:WYL domain-containing protein [Microbacterium sp. zg.Y843]MCR2814721.1 WYL domain-containing protein [Microbacterium sp. zg.Y843]